MNDWHCAALALQGIPGVGARTLNRFLLWAKQNGSALADLFDLSDESLKGMFKLRAESINILRQTTLESAQSILEVLEDKGFQVLLRGDPQYPSQLETHLGENTPPVLIVWGNRSLLSKPGIAFSGSRHTSPQGINRTQVLAAQAALRGLTVISGHAPGTDIAAHLAALENDGETIMVLPEGAMRFHPHAALQALLDPIRAAVISEFPPNIPWSAQNAMIRNQTIVGLAQALVVIEAGASGGTLAAGRRALKLKVPVHVLRLPDSSSDGTGNEILIAEGASPLPVAPELQLPDILMIPFVDNDPSKSVPPAQLSLFDP